ncbi:MAG: DUF748 domain-containing protein [Nibricoccus sp.]
METHTRSRATRKEDGVKVTVRRRTWRARLVLIVTVVVAVLLLIQLVISPIVKAVVNKKLAAMEGYSGRVGSLNIALWRGAISAGDFVLRERGRDDEPPVVKVHRISANLSWVSLFHGRLGGDLYVDQPETTFVKRREVNLKEAGDKVAQKTEEAKQQVMPWRDALRQMFPIEIGKLESQEGKARFIDKAHEPVVDVALEHIKLVGTGLRTQQDGEELPAKVELTAVMTGNGKLKITAQADPLAKPPHFKTTMELQSLDLTAINPLLLAYADADVARGTFEFFLEVNAANGGYQGYTKPFFRDLDFKAPSVEGKPVKKLARKAANAVVGILKNDEEGKVATKVPFSGTFDKNQVDIWTTISNLLRNAFVQALKEGFEGGGKASGGEGK